VKFGIKYNQFHPIKLFILM